MKRIIGNILFLMTLMMTTISAFGAEWRIHPTFDNYVDRVIVGGEYVYVAALAQPLDVRYSEYNTPRIFLYRYDKSNDELLPLTSQNILKRSMVHAVEYNHAKKYLLVVYDDYDIDLIYDNGTRKNIPGLKLAEIRESKNVNGITFHPSSNRAYLATDFGYVEINDEKAEISTSRNYGRKFVTVGRLGENLFIGDENRLYYVSAVNTPLSFAGFKEVRGIELPVKLFNYNDEKVGLVAGKERFTDLYFINPDGDDFEIKKVYSGYFITQEQLPDGFMISTPSIILHYIRGEKKEEFNRTQEDNSLPVGSRDFREFWFAKGRVGIKSMNCVKTENEYNWKLTRDYMLPNVSPVFISTHMVYHPVYGMLLSNHGIDTNFTQSDVPVPNLLSGLKGAEWKRFSPAYTKPDYTLIQRNPNGLTLDPDNDNYVYAGSMLDGILRLNLSNPDDILLLSQPRSNFATIPEFVPLAPVIAFWDVMCSFQAPQFDSKGNLWCSYFNLDKSRDIRTDGKNIDESCELWFWPRENRIATKDPASFKPWGKMTFENIAMTNAAKVLPLRSSANSNVVLLIPNSFNGPFIFLDTKGTINDLNDDSNTIMSTFVDQDGASVAYYYVHSIFEDVATGLVWVGTDTGVFTINPAEIMKGTHKVNKIKVARNDGTDLADYLLNGVKVNAITEDGNGRKWFGTGGAGLVCTSSDGRNIIAEYTSDNSLLPDNTIFGLCHNPDNNSLMVSTDKGLAELFLESAGGVSDFDSARAYPNPVRPDYYGFVTIDGLEDGAIVKIVDATGNLVKELGFAANGTLEWDVTNISHKRVKTGVYYVLASSGPDNEASLAKVAKILVVN